MKMPGINLSTIPFWLLIVAIFLVISLLITLLVIAVSTGRQVNIGPIKIGNGLNTEKTKALADEKDKLLIDCLAERIKYNPELSDSFMILLEHTSHEEYLEPTLPIKKIVCMGLFEMRNSSDRYIKYKLTSLGVDVRNAFFKK